MYHLIPSVTTPPPWATPRYLTENHAKGQGFAAHINSRREWDLIEAWKLQKFSIQGLFLPKIAFSVSKQEYEREFGFKNSEACINVLYLIYLMTLII